MSAVEVATALRASLKALGVGSDLDGAVEQVCAYIVREKITAALLQGPPPALTTISCPRLPSCRHCRVMSPSDDRVTR